jgi:hypothetical protein
MADKLGMVVSRVGFAQRNLMLLGKSREAVAG